MTTSEKRTIIVVAETHWDREWYQPFEVFRARLVRLVDRVIDLLDSNPEYKYYTLDGQSIVLEDYLEIRPDRRDDIARLVRAGRLLIGPSYVLPDEFLTGGESHIRNFQLGIAVARQFGPVMMVGYMPDTFGHMAHMPAVLAGFGMEGAVMWRGADKSLTSSEFFWRAPDGSEVLTAHMVMGYGIASYLWPDRERLLTQLQSLREMLEPWASTHFLLLPNGTDHTEPQPQLPAIIATANEALDNAELVHGSVPMYIEAVRQEMGDRSSSWLRWQGEFRSSERAHVLPSVGSTRMWIKQENQACEDLLLRWAEPFSTWAHLLRRPAGAEPEEGETPPSWEASGWAASLRADRDDAERAAADAGSLRLAWRLLLQNQPHDSICGCSTDEVHDEMKVRFRRCRRLGEAVRDGALAYLAEAAAPTGGPHVVVFNPLNVERTDYCTARVPVEAGLEVVALEDGDGGSIPVQFLRRGRLEPLDPLPERVEVGFLAPQVPAVGYRALRVVYGQGERPQPQPAHAIENEHFRVEADTADGSLSLTDKATGVTLRGLNRFVDGGDAGDEYNFSPPDQDELVDHPSRPPEIRLLEDGPARWTLEIALEYSLPQALAFDDYRGRSSERVPCRIVSRVSLCPGVPRLDFETEVDNQAGDHRLRVHFPAGLHTDVSRAEQHFGVVRRPIAVEEHDATWAEVPQGTYAQKAFVDVNDGRRGLTLANSGLPEYEVLDAPDGVTIALTLLRCVGWLSRSWMRTRPVQAGPLIPTPGAQERGRHLFHYSLIPHEGGWEAAFSQAHRFAVPPRAVFAAAGKGQLSPMGSLLSARPESFVLSTLKEAEDADARSGQGLIVRLYNTADQPAEGEVRLDVPWQAVERVNLNEEPLGPAEVRDGWVRLSLRPNEIATLRFRV
jgi:mannosylglycerate hydrolase